MSLYWSKSLFFCVGCATCPAFSQVLSPVIRKVVTSSGGVEKLGAYSPGYDTKGAHDADGVTRVIQLDVKTNLTQVANHTLSRQETPECIALAASTAAYAFVQRWQDIGGATACLKAEGYRLITNYTKRSSQGTLKDVDYVGLWSNDTGCIMNFKGSENFLDFTNNFNIKMVDAWGIPGVHAGLREELKGLLELMDFSLIRTTCKGKSLTITGHSLGGGLAQLFALLLNKESDPLSAGITADSLYTFGSMVVSDTPGDNDATKDGSFAGGLFWNAQKNDDGTISIDVAKNKQIGGHLFNPVKAVKTLLFGQNSNEHQNYGPGTSFPGNVRDFFEGTNLKKWITGPFYHKPELYRKNLRCLFITKQKRPILEGVKKLKNKLMPKFRRHRRRRKGRGRKFIRRRKGRGRRFRRRFR